MWETHQEEWYEYQDELLWAAGLFEGEGCLTLCRGHAYLKLCSTDEDVVRRFHAAIGLGTVRREDYFQRKHGYKVQWRWQLGAKAHVNVVIHELLPHLGRRRRDRAAQLLQVLERAA